MFLDGAFLNNVFRRCILRNSNFLPKYAAIPIFFLILHSLYTDTRLLHQLIT